MKLKRRILSIIIAFTLCLGMLPTGALAANATITTPLDFTKMGDGEGQTPAKGPGYEFTGDSSGYTLTLDGLSLNATEYNDTIYWGQEQVRAAIVLPEDGPVTIQLRGSNTISASCQWDDEDAIAIRGPFPVTIEGSGTLVTNVHNAVVASTGSSATGNITINNVTIIENRKGEGIWCRSGSVSIENANLTIAAKGTNASAIYASKNIAIKNSNITASCDESTGICAAGDITITGGTITATSNAGEGSAKILAFGSLSIDGGANITTTGSTQFGIFANGGTMTLSQSEISANGTTCAIYASNGVTVKGMALIEPSDGKMGPKGALDANDSWITSAKLVPVTLNVPTNPLICTYGDQSASVTLTSTPASGDEVIITDKDSKEVGKGNLGQPIDINTSGFQAGDVTLTATAEGVTRTFTVTVKPRPLTVTGATATNREYDKTKEVTITAVALDGVKAGDTVSVNTTGLKGTISGADAGDYTAVTMPALTLTGASAGNYTLTQPTGAVSTNVKISKTNYSGTKTASTSAKTGATASYDLRALLPDGAALDTLTTTGDIFDGTPTVSGKTLSYKLKSDAVAKETGTITVPVTNLTNYNDFNLTVTVTVTDKDVPILSVTPITTTYTGEAVPDTAITGTATVNEQTVEGAWTFTEGQNLTNVADSGTKTVKFVPTDTANYAEATGTILVTINKATLTGAPQYTAITTSGKTLADAGLTPLESWPAGTLSWALGSDTQVTANTEYEWTFTPTDTANYATLTGKIKLWVQSTPPSGGSSGGSTPLDQSVTTGPNHEGGTSTTQTTATPTAATQGGKSTASVSTAMGNEIVKQAAENKSDTVVIAPKGTGSATKTEVSIPASTVGQIGSQTSASLTVSTSVADVTIHNGGLGSLASVGGTVTVTAEQSGNTVELTVTAGGKVIESVPGGVTLTVPTGNPTPGTVAMLVREDGTREVIRKSAANETGVTIPLDGSAKLVIVDNSKQFDDVPAASWAADAVAFASSHELFNGTAPGKFSPDVSMSRGMLAVVLHNLESNPEQAFTGIFGDVENGKWYAEGISWAAANGIVDGYGNGQFGPNGPITREQLAVMLWRYAGKPEATGTTLSFSDADKISDYAQEALRWAVEQGIVQGKGNGILDPKGKATRAEVAVMLMRYFGK